MISFSDIQTEITNRVVDNENLLNNAWFLRQVPEVYAYIITKTGGFWLHEEGTFTTVSGTGDYALNSDVLVIKQLMDTTNRKPIPRALIQDEAFFDPSRSTSAIASGYVGTYLREYQAQPTASSKLTIISSSASDTTTYNIYVRGKIALGYEVSETVTITGTTGLTTSNTYLLTTGILSLRKNVATNGTITITSNAGVVTNAVMQPNQLRCQYPWVRLLAKSGGTYAHRYLYIRKPMPLVASYDYMDVHEFLEECAMMKFEEMANRTLQQFNMANDILMRNEKLIAERLKFLNQKPDQFVTWQGGERGAMDFMTEVYNANLR